MGSGARRRRDPDLSAEEAEQRLRPLVGDAQGLDRELLLDLEGLQPRGFLRHVGIDDRTETFTRGVG